MCAAGARAGGLPMLCTAHGHGRVIAGDRARWALAPCHVLTRAYGNVSARWMSRTNGPAARGVTAHILAAGRKPSGCGPITHTTGRLALLRQPPPRAKLARASPEPPMHCRRLQCPSAPKLRRRTSSGKRRGNGLHHRDLQHSPPEAADWLGHPLRIGTLNAHLLRVRPCTCRKGQMARVGCAEGGAAEKGDGVPLTFSLQRRPPALHANGGIPSRSDLSMMPTEDVRASNR